MPIELPNQEEIDSESNSEIFNPVEFPDLIEFFDTEVVLPAEFPYRHEIFNSKVNADIDNIYKLIRRKRFLTFMDELKPLLTSIRLYYNDSPSFSGQEPIEGLEASSEVFSQFLQHLFLYIPDFFNNIKILDFSKKNVYIEVFLSNILREEKDYFFYTKENGRITTWIDPNTGNTALISACNLGNSNIVTKLLNILLKEFTPKNSDSTNELNPDLKKYFFHENYQGFTAWNRVLLKGDTEIHKLFIKFGSKLRLTPKGYNEFLLQRDPQGNSVLIKAVKTQNKALLYAFLDIINNPFKGRISNEMPFFLNEKDAAGQTVLNLACEWGDHFVVRRLLKSSLITFNSKTDLAFFLNSISIQNQHTSPLIFASKAGDSLIVYSILKVARTHVYDKDQPDIFFNFVNQEDEGGYTALMRASEMNRQSVVKVFTKMCGSTPFQNSEFPYARILAYVSTKGITALEVATKAYHILPVVFLLYGMDMLDPASDVYKNFINHKDRNGQTPLKWLVNKEKTLQYEISNKIIVTITAEEKQNSMNRKIIARQLFSYYADTKFARERIPEGWTFLQRRIHILPALVSNYNSDSQFQRVPMREQEEFNFFQEVPLSFMSRLMGIFCFNVRRHKRELSDLCRINDDDFLPSLSIEPSEILKENLFNVNAYIENLHSDALTQVGVIRNQAFISEREKQELSRYSEAVNQHYLEQGNELLNRLKKNTALNLQQGLERNTQYILIDNGKNLLILNKKAVFSTMLNPAQAFGIIKRAQNSEIIEQWLRSYFSKEYTVHPFNKEDIAPLSVEKFLTQPIHSDNLFMELSIEGVSRKNLQELFLLKGEPIKSIDMAKDTFIQDKHSELTFRAERFHKVFFDLSVEGKKAFKNLLIRYPFFTQVAYDALNDEEKKYLANYGNRIMNLMRNADADTIDATDLLGISINTHKGLLSDETDLKSIDKEALINSLEDFKKSLKNKGKVHHKAVLQLLVFMFPSVIRSMAERDPLQLAMPIALMTSDMALNTLLVQLTKHPKTLQLFAGELSSKLLAITGKVGGRVPVLGSALAVYALVRSGKAFINSSKEDPNHRYYKELLLNNLATLGVMGAEMALSLPFWPVIGVFAALTLQQVSVEGAIKENDLHLHDDEGHPLLNFYRRMELGFGIVDEHIKTVLQQQNLLDIALDCFKLQSSTDPYSIMAVTLPKVEVIKGSVTCLQQAATQNHLSALNPNLPPVSNCKSQTLHIKRRGKYEFGLGKTRIICQTSDALNSSAKNFTLLTGTYAPNSRIPLQTCTEGQKKVSYGLAIAEDEDAAALIVDKNVHEQKANQYSLFIPVDPSYITEVSLNLENGNNESAQQDDPEIDSLLPCPYPLSYCVEKVVVAITPFYPIEPNNGARKTKVFIDNRELQYVKNSRDKELIYLIRTSKNLHLEALGIKKQSFLFFNESLIFKFEGGKLKATDGFETNLANITYLRLEFSNSSWMVGQFEATESQEIIINRLHGIDDNHLAILKAVNYEVGLYGYSSLITKVLQLDVRSSIEEPILACQATAYSKSVYQLMHPVNRFFIYKKDTVRLSLRNDNLFKPIAVIALRTVDPLSSLNVDFSGHYFLQEKPYNCRIILNKSSDYVNAWRVILKIDINTDLHHLIDLAAIQASHFDQLTLVASYDVKPITTYYIFLQQESLPEINGNFISLKFVDRDEEGLFLHLTTVDNKEQTFLILDTDKQKEIIINKIRYKIDWVFPSILAQVTQEKDSEIDARQLLAPIKINMNSDELQIDLVNSSFKLGSVTLVNVPLKLQLRFNDKEVPMSMIAYLNSTSPIQEQQTPRAELIKDEKVLQNTESAWSHLYTIMAGAVTGYGIFCLRRFFRPKQASMVVSGAVVLPLLNARAAEAESIKSHIDTGSVRFFSDDFYQFNNQATYKKGLTDFWDRGSLTNQILSNQTLCIEYKAPTKSIPNPFDFANTLKQVNFNQQAIFLYYLQSFKRKSSNSFKPYKNASNEKIFNSRSTNSLVKNNQVHDCQISRVCEQYSLK